MFRIVRFIDEKIKFQKLLTIIFTSLFATSIVTACGNSSTATTATSQAGGIRKIKHVVVIMQENRSFDTYFGTYPNEHPPGKAIAQ